MRIASLAIDPLTTLPIVTLEDEAGVEAAYIRVGASDASAIAAELDDIELVRPTTHRLMGDLLEGAGVRVTWVEIDAPDEGSFFGVIHLELPSGERARHEARTSDALALALRAGAEIRVTPAVVDRAERPAPLVDDDHGAAAALPAGGPPTLTVADEALDLVVAPGKWKM